MQGLQTEPTVIPFDTKEVLSNSWRMFTHQSKDYLLHLESLQILELPLHFIKATLQTQESHPDLIHRLKKLSARYETSEPTPKLPSITSIALNVAEKCNLRCTYCYAGEGNYGNESTMSEDVAIRAIKSFQKRDQKLHIRFFGGEPLLNFRLIEKIVAWCEASGYRHSYGITTNGILMTQTHMDFFKRYQFMLTLSYDGKTLQDKQRRGIGGQKLSQKLRQKMERFSKDLGALRNFSLRMTADKNHLSSLSHEILETLNSHQYRLYYARASSRQKNLDFQMSDIEKIGMILHEVGSSLLNARKYSTLLRLGNLKRMILMIHEGRPRHHYCNAGLQYISVSTSGEFFLCHRFTEDSEERLGDIHSGLDDAKRRTLLEQRKMTLPPCNSCWMRKLCGGGCFHEHKMATGSIRKVDPKFCRLQEIELSFALKAYLEIKKNAEHLLFSSQPASKAKTVNHVVGSQHAPILTKKL